MWGYKAVMLKLTGYQIFREIYASTRTLVYQGIREQDQKPVVIKLLRRKYPSFKELLQLRNQYTIAKNLKLEGIIKPYSLEPYKNSYALVMEDFGGISLKDYLNHLKTQNSSLWASPTGSCYTSSHKDTSVAFVFSPYSRVGVSDRTQEAQERCAMPLQQFLHIAIQIASTLQELYRNRVIHKDIKPANILINPTTVEVRLTDFSIASVVPKEIQILTNPNVLEGTLAYISPEQTGRMNRGIDYRSDFYSLGVTFFELLTRQLPFTTTDPIELVYCHIAKQPPNASSINPSIPSVVSDIINLLMAKKC